MTDSPAVSSRAMAKAKTNGFIVLLNAVACERLSTNLITRYVLYFCCRVHDTKHDIPKPFLDGKFPVSLGTGLKYIRVKILQKRRELEKLETATMHEIYNQM